MISPVGSNSIVGITKGSNADKRTVGDLMNGIKGAVLGVAPQTLREWVGAIYR